MTDDTTLGGIARRRLRGAVTACLPLALVLGVVTAARAQFDLQTKLTASNASKQDQFGYSVAISGDMAIVGARQADVGVHAFAGSAYLFDSTTGQQLFELTATDAARLDVFGNSVAISGNRAIVGAVNDEHVGADSGSAYLFTSSSPPSDLTNNGFVDFEDLTVLLANWKKVVGADAGNLVNADTTPVNFEDLTVLLADWTGPGPAGAPDAALAAVPEPSSLLLALFGALALALLSREWERGAREGRMSEPKSPIKNREVTGE